MATIKPDDLKIEVEVRRINCTKPVDLLSFLAECRHCGDTGERLSSDCSGLSVLQLLPSCRARSQLHKNTNTG